MTDRSKGKNVKRACFFDRLVLVPAVVIYFTLSPLVVRAAALERVNASYGAISGSMAQTWVAKEARLVFEAKKRFGLCVLDYAVTSNHIHLLVVVGYDFEDTSIVRNYFTAAGFDVLGIERLPVPWEEVGRLSSTEVYYHVKRLFLKHPDADGIYFQGGKLRILDIIELLEQDLRIPVLHPGVAQAWEIQKRLNVRQPMTGYGPLLAEMP